MEYWEFLLQKEGDRAWQPIKTPKLEIEEGRYRIVAHSNRPNTDVEIRLTHQSAGEVPPKRRSQKRSRRTNREGLMVVIPYTYLKPGTWELRCSGDIMSDLLGQTWRHSVQFQVAPNPESIQPPAPLQSSPVALKPEVSEPEAPIDAKEAETVKEMEALLTALTPPDEVPEAQPALPVVAETPVETETSLPAPAAIVPPAEPAELVVPPVAQPNKVETSPPLHVGTYVNPLLEQSLQNLEQMLQQVLEPILQDFDGIDEATPEIQQLSAIDAYPFDPTDTDSNLQGLLLNLDQETLVAHRGESLTLSGQVDFLDIAQHNGYEIANDLASILKGTLRICLRDPQNSQLLLDMQHPLPEQVPPLTFSYTFDLPASCQTRLILGEVILYDALLNGLASQSFTITVDLEELVGTVLGHKSNGTSTIAASSPTEAIAEADLLAPLPIQEEEPVRAKLAFFDVKETPPAPVPLQPATSKTLPPQLYQPTEAEKAVKAPQLPKLPKPAIAVSELKPDAEASGYSVDFWDEEDQLDGSPDHLPVARIEPVSGETLLQPKELELDPAIVTESQGNAEDTSAQVSNSVTVEPFSRSYGTDEPSPEAQNTVKWVPKLLPTPSPFTDELSEEENLLHREPSAEPSATPLTKPTFEGLLNWQPAIQSAATQAEDSAANPPAEVDNDFQSLNLQDRFWSRLNALAADSELYESLKEDLLAFESQADTDAETDALESSAELTEAETVIEPIDWDTEPDEQAEALAPQDEEVETYEPTERMAEPLDWEAEPHESSATAADLSDWDAETYEPTEQVAEPLDWETEPHEPSATSPDSIDWEVESHDRIETPLDPIDWDAETDDQTETRFQEEISTSEDSAIPEDTLEAELPVINADASLDWTTQEIVVDDELPLVRASVSPTPATGLGYATAQNQSLPETPISLMEDKLVPMPELIVPTTDLTAGEPVTVRVKLPLNSDPFYVKLWIQDRQSRLLLDGPRCLLDFSPSSATLETMTQLTIPYGSMEIRFEAITIDAATQRESHKVTIDRVVVPANVPSFSLDEFET